MKKTKSILRYIGLGLVVAGITLCGYAVIFVEREAAGIFFLPGLGLTIAGAAVLWLYRSKT